METIIYLIRHSEQLRLDEQKILNEEEWLQNEKVILSIEGEKKALKMSKQDELKNIDKLWSSSFSRAVGTAKYIASENKININIDPSFNERRLGNKDELDQLGKNAKYSYTTEQIINPKLKVKNGESREETEARFSKAFYKVLKENRGKRVAIISHGAAIKFFLLNFCNFDISSRAIIFKNKIIATERLNSPEIFKFVFQNEKILNIEKIDIG